MGDMFTRFLGSTRAPVVLAAWAVQASFWSTKHTGRPLHTLKLAIMWTWTIMKTQLLFGKEQRRSVFLKLVSWIGWFGGVSGWLPIFPQEPGAQIKPNQQATTPNQARVIWLKISEPGLRVVSSFFPFVSGAIWLWLKISALGLRVVSSFFPFVSGAIWLWLKISALGLRVVSSFFPFVSGAIWLWLKISALGLRVVSSFFPFVSGAIWLWLKISALGLRGCLSLFPLVRAILGAPIGLWNCPSLGPWWHQFTEQSLDSGSSVKGKWRSSKRPNTHAIDFPGLR